MILSIIVPVYNVRLYLEECINSIVSQLNEEMELILVNDGSNDGSELLCDRFAKEHNSIKVIHQKNLGQSVARNNGIKIATGKYVQFIDSDDVLSAEAINKIFFAIKHFKTDVVLLNYTYGESASSIDPIYRKGAYFKKLVNGKMDLFLSSMFRKIIYSVPPWRTIVSRSLIEENSLYFYEGIYHEDSLWSPLVHMKMKTAYVIEEPVYHYRINRPGNTTKSKDYARLSHDFIVVSLELIKEINTLKGDVIRTKFIRKNISKCFLYGLMYASCLSSENVDEVIKVIKNKYNWFYFWHFLRRKAKVYLLLFGTYKCINKMADEILES